MPVPSSGTYRFGELTLDLIRGALRNGDRELPLRPKSFDILTYFVTNAGRLLSKDELMQAAWPGVFVTEDSLVQCVREIRRAVGENGQTLIKTVTGRGYLFDVPVTMVVPTKTAATDSAPRLSIVVLPFINLSNDPEQEYFADGITDNLITAISYTHGSFVVARGTAFTYKGKSVDAREIGRDLGVRYLLEGSVQRSAKQIRVNAQLIDTGTGAHLWAQNFDRPRGDLFTVEDEITARIAGTLDLELTDIEARRAERHSASVDAMDYAMRGHAVLNRPVFTKEKYQASAAMFEKALQLDEDLPSARAGLASALAGRVTDDFSDAPEDDLRRAEELVFRVIANHPNYSYAHHVKAQILRAQKHYDEAIIEYETAIALNPMYTPSLNHLARSKILIGEPSEAIPLLENIIRISPRDPMIGYVYWRLGLANLLMGNTDEAILWYKRAVRIYYSPPDAYRHLAAALSLRGDKVAAQAALVEAIRLDPRNATISWARIRRLSTNPKFVELDERTEIEGLRRLGLPEE